MVFKDLNAAWAAGRPASGGVALKLNFWASCSCVVLGHNPRRSVVVALDGTPVGNVTIPPNFDVPAPGQVVEVRYLHVTAPGGSLYQPVNRGVRDDVGVNAALKLIFSRYGTDRILRLLSAKPQNRRIPNRRMSKTGRLGSQPSRF